MGEPTILGLAEDRGAHPIKRLLLLIGPLVASAAITLVLYGASTSYGFMFDDPLDLPRASGRSFFSILTGAGESSYYRPLILVLWKILYEFYARNDPAVLHALALTAHAIDGWLVYIVGARTQGRVGGWISALLFVSFPLSYQAVAHVNAFFHPLVTMYLLLSVVLYWNWRRRGRPVMLSLAAVSAVLAVFTHEYGVVVAPLIFTAEAYYLLSRGERRPSRAPALFAFVSIGFLLIWWVMPRWQHTWEFDPASLRLNSLYFFQGLVYPLASRLADWPGNAGSSPAGTLLLFGLPVVALMAILHALSRRALSLGFALVWTAIGLLPALASLPFTYIIDSPRLFYLSSVGISLAWGGMLSAPFRWKARLLSVPSGVLSIALAALILVQSALFVQERTPLFLEGSRIVQQLAATATDPRWPGRTYVNFPSWFALKRPDYILGHTGVIMVPDYIGLGRVAYIQTGEQPEIVSAAYDVIAGQWDYHYASHGKGSGLDELEAAFRRGGGVYATRFYSGTVKLEFVGAIGRRQAGSEAPRYIADFGGWGQLVSAEVQQKAGVVDLVLQWASSSPLEKDHTMFVHVYDAAGGLVAQADGYPIGQMFPPQRWRPGDLIADRRLVTLPAGAPPGTYQVFTGAYDRQNGQRAPAHNAAGARYKDDAVPVGSVVIGGGK